MTKNEFLKSLKQELERHKVHNVQDVLADYEEHFEHGLAKGKSEFEISQSLGQTSTIAKAYKADSLINEVKNPENGFQWSLAINVVGRLLIIAPFNFIVLFIPSIVIFSLLVTGWVLSLAISAAGLAIAGVFPALISFSATSWAWIAAASASLGVVSLGILLGMIMFIITKYILLALINYLQWNIKFITQK